MYTGRGLGVLVCDGYYVCNAVTGVFELTREYVDEQIYLRIQEVIIEVLSLITFSRA